MPLYKQNRRQLKKNICLCLPKYLNVFHCLMNSSLQAFFTHRAFTSHAGRHTDFSLFGQIDDCGHGPRQSSIPAVGQYKKIKGNQTESHRGQRHGIHVR